MIYGSCSAPGCTEPHHGRGLCSIHFGRARNRGTAISYTDMHCNVRNQRGHARHHPCTDCGNPAAEWSYDYQDPDEVRADTGTRFSLNVDHYVPRCKPCHQATDQQQRADELRAAAIELEPRIRNAIAERNRARKHGDHQAEDHWDDELERLTAQLLTS